MNSVFRFCCCYYYRVLQIVKQKSTSIAFSVFPSNNLAPFLVSVVIYNTLKYKNSYTLSRAGLILKNPMHSNSKISLCTHKHKHKIHSSELPATITQTNAYVQRLKCAIIVIDTCFCYVCLCLFFLFVSFRFLYRSSFAFVSFILFDIAQHNKIPNKEQLLLRLDFYNPIA